MSRKKKVLIVEPSIIIKEGLIKILGKSSCAHPTARRTTRNASPWHVQTFY